MAWLQRSIINGPNLCLVLNQRDFARALSDCDIPMGDRGDFVTHGAMATTHVVQRRNGQYACVVALQGWEGEDPVTVAGMLVHEAVHVWQTARDDMMREPKPGIEVEAYSIQWISQQLMWSFIKQTKGAA